MKFKFILLTALSIILGCAQSIDARELVASINSKIYWIDDILARSEITPLIAKGDSLVVMKVKPTFRFQDIDFREFDILLIDSDPVIRNWKLYKEMSDEDVPEYMEKVDARQYVKALNAKSYVDYVDKVKDLAPRGYVDYWRWIPDYADGIKAMFKYFNAYHKTIKYITFYLQFKNAVGDVVRDKLSGKALIPFKCIGPVEEGNLGVWDDLSDVFAYVPNASTCQIKKVVIQYMDNTTYTLIKELKFANDDN